MAYSFATFTDKAAKTMTHVKEDVALLRTGKATIQMLDPVVVEAYGATMKVNEVANISAPDANMLVVQPWDGSLLENLEKGIASAGLNLNPVVDGDMIRIVVPPLTEERRKEMVKLLHQKIESGKKMLRTVRTDSKQEIENQEGEAGVSEDDIHRDLEQLDKEVQKYMDQLDALAENKEKELLQV